MKSYVFIAGLVLVAAGLVGYMATENRSGEMVEQGEANQGVVATIFKSPSCGCCGQYAAYLEDRKYAVKVEKTTAMDSVKEQYDVPYELQSCHTMEIDGYVVEGHVPEEAVAKLLSERPDIKGIGMAGMPSGSPGMPGPKNDDFVIYEITHEGTQGDVFMTI